MTDEPDGSATQRHHRGRHSADLAIFGARIRTLDPSSPHASAVAIRDGETVAVGSDDTIRGRCDSQSEILDGSGIATVPGLTGPHQAAIGPDADPQCQVTLTNRSRLIAAAAGHQSAPPAPPASPAAKHASRVSATVPHSEPRKAPGYPVRAWRWRLAPPNTDSCRCARL
jgi:hypothetical protein